MPDYRWVSLAIPRVNAIRRFQIGGFLKTKSSPLRHEGTKEHKAQDKLIHRLGAASCLCVFVARPFQRPAGIEIGGDTERKLVFAFF